MSYLILVRHGQSTWNLEKKFTGWVDVDLTENGKLEAKKAGDLIKLNNIDIDIIISNIRIFITMPLQESECMIRSNHYIRLHYYHILFHHSISLG